MLRGGRDELYREVEAVNEGAGLAAILVYVHYMFAQEK